MVVERVLGNINDYDCNNRSVDKVYLEWYEFEKKLLKKTAQSGEEIGIRLSSHLHDGDILYEDESLLILNKPAGIPVHPSMEHYTDSLSNGVKYYFEQISLKRKIRPVNRLDRNTSGIVIFAKNQYIQECLIKQMKTDEFKKEYLALVNGSLSKKEQIILAPISRNENSIIERCVAANGSKAITIVELLKNFDNYSLIKCILKTGRTHQIRVHMQFIKHPILGDTLYGVPSDLINRQALHAYKICFSHPITKEKINIIAELPEDIKKLINN